MQCLGCLVLLCLMLVGDAAAAQVMYLLHCFALALGHHSSCASSPPVRVL